MPEEYRSPQKAGKIHAVVAEDDILVAAFLEGVLLDQGITADWVEFENCCEHALRRRYDVAVVGIDKDADDVLKAVRFLQRRRIIIVFFSVLGDPHNMAAKFPHIPISCYDARDSGQLATRVLSVLKSRIDCIQPSPPRNAHYSETRRS